MPLQAVHVIEEHREGRDGVMNLGDVLDQLELPEEVVYAPIETPGCLNSAGDFASPPNTTGPVGPAGRDVACGGYSGNGGHGVHGCGDWIFPAPRWLAYRSFEHGYSRSSANATALTLYTLDPADGTSMAMPVSGFANTAR